MISEKAFSLPELPPRARRILKIAAAQAHSARTTSACAENTRGWGFRAGGLGNYLRVRGEYLVEALNILAPMELPPRARRILAKGLVDAVLKGTTSACAENTENRVER